LPCLTTSKSMVEWAGASIRFNRHRMKYRLKRRDYYRAYCLHIKPRRSYAILGILLVCIGLATGSLCLLVWEDTVLGILVLSGIVFVLSTVYLFPLYPLQKCWRQTKGIDSDIELSVGNDSFSLGSETNRSTIPYENIFRIRSNRDYLLVYSNQYVYWIIPKSTDDLAEAAHIIEKRFRQKMK
jgi:hypothetical protein